MSLLIEKPGLLTTIQDLGRFGYQKHGVLTGGAMDTYSLRIANFLVGNPENEAALEITLMGPGPSLRAEEDVLLAAAGADAALSIDGSPMKAWKPFVLKKDQTLTFGPRRSGSRCYLAAAGGFDVPIVMNSKSTYLRGAIGGFSGRALQKGDPLKIGEKKEAVLRFMNKLLNEYSCAAPEWSVYYPPFLSFKKEPVIRVIPGEQFEKFTNETQKKFFSEAFQISGQSDRMGYRMNGPQLKLTEPLEMLSEAVSFGTIQVPPDGNPIILMADRQTTGGYPRIGQIITADLPTIGQLMPGEKLRFSPVTRKEAEDILIENEQMMTELQTGIALEYRKT